MKNTSITLDQGYIDQVKQNVTPHWGELGWVTYKRTYARWLPEKNRSENWDETVKRVVEGNINLDPRLKDSPSTEVVNELTNEAKDLFKLVYGLGATPSGRNLWVSGTDYQKRNGDSLNNCWFIAIRPQKYGDSHIVPDYLNQDQEAVSMPFSFLFDESMKGGGVGFSVVQDNIKKIPAVDNKIDLTVVINKKSASYADSIKLGATDKDEWIKQNDGKSDYIYYNLPDTREGWVLANARLIDVHFNQTNSENKTKLVLDISRIRPYGAKIHGFGGTASGPMPLVEMFFDINNIINNRVGGNLTSVDCTDICNLIGKTVVAGNVRRSAELALGTSTDQDFITMKQDKDKLYHHRWASNNSVAIDSNFNEYEPIANGIRENGEPGVVNLDLSRNYGRIIDGYQKDIDGDVEGTNPCGEISLGNGEPCNLFEVFPYIAEQENWDLKDVFRLATRFAKRVTFSDYDWEISRNIIYKNRRIGVSMSGIQDWLLNDLGHRVVTGFEDSTDKETGEKIKKPIYDPQGIKMVTDAYQAVIAADKEYSKTLKCNESIKHTTVKPSGTVAKLAGASEGMHFHYAGYLIQRIRFQASDPLLKALDACGYYSEPDIYSPNTTCVEFPLRAAHADSKNFASAGTVSIEEQFATQAFLQTYWSDNAVSCTVTFQSDEGDKITSLFKQYRHVIKSTSLLPYYGGSLKQAPKEPIDKKKYEERKAQITGDVAQVFAEQNDDQKDLELVDQTDCESGACPVK
ncbi:ribonucleoside-triphosphate reductase, adenosylcobalamin-dependent [Lactobacillus sp. M0398]|uniref:ribonucleoside-triphosphate reductase, adenosylcobalamin-dependent n=1 Tax=unclassified Lactobacillus TaxID=2620435 RepID=UPI0018DCB36C|nr:MULTISPECIES: ribonucleoside-triphosphate reductase, adenosylcobalamin-dependent [unclassified Lactobacillus]MBI0121349.1 ribonucleoside-triphosphate reductase, adenosylcobalamin-dependent [Lactobacillus sp. M0398]MBI0123496.1 ribonucleoside-triphosphate reductase, adenosylcobalamin-dependent [Lactobacillus sp. W8174]MBI0135439.1 ribonucleoside-triphosphate reductase, adenosylcobalamin-dependent [Lactobacillus sp. W8173]